MDDEMRLEKLDAKALLKHAEEHSRMLKEIRHIPKIESPAEFKEIMEDTLDKIRPNYMSVNGLDGQEFDATEMAIKQEYKFKYMDLVLLGRNKFYDNIEVLDYIDVVEKELKRWEGHTTDDKKGGLPTVLETWNETKDTFAESWNETKDEISGTFKEIKKQLFDSFKIFKKFKIK